tara:strand:- start:317 stop:469 length:153 start_codon:yes stop_codon:yes gene_type:complete
MRAPCHQAGSIGMEIAFFTGCGRKIASQKDDSPRAQDTDFYIFNPRIGTS